MKNKFANTLIKLLKTKGLTQKELCKLLNIQESSISHWMKGKSVPSMKSVVKIADYFKVPYSVFYDEKSGVNTSIINNGNNNNNTINNNEHRIELLEEKVKRLELEIELLKKK